MAYSNFSLSKIKANFGLIFYENTELFSTIQPIPPSDYLTLILKEHLPLVTAINTEKAHSELVIMPVLIEVRRYFQYQISVFSGSEFNVDADKGLEGRCDFILSRSPEQYDITNPVMTIVEAKNESIKSGLGQCIATMIAAQIFNQKQGNPTDAIYGAVTTGTDWKFLKLVNNSVFIDMNDYYISAIEQILGIIVATLNSVPILSK
ncbi:MAG: hypothetical protein HC769_03985 [Cyanobacteria bacterium CRU_2_1]|nr:hypothetical protein [Cyanobacteria bacterium RU_5_0]NJR58079.1 hypothetical protein [Cyanobacteria bacterium CRU_2_1]